MELWSLVVLFFSMIIQVIVPPLPAELIVVAAGNQFGIFLTTLVAGTGLWIGGIIVYYLGFFIHAKFDRFFGRKKVKKITELIRTYQVPILWVRILPYNPSDIISYAAGIVKVERKRFITISFFTSYIRCLLLAWLGSIITSFATLSFVLALLLVSALGAHYLIQKKR